jgi:TonB family protein
VTVAARISAAVGASLVLHAAALAVIERMPRGWQVDEPAAREFGAGVLNTRLRESSNPSQPAALAAPPRAALGAARQPAFGPVAPPLYLPASELDEKPLIRNHVEPEFPVGAMVSEGRVVLRLFIAETGNVDEIAVVSAGPRQIFAEAATRAFARALFTPGRKDGAPVKSTMTIELLFGAPLPVAQSKPPEGPLFQPPRRGRPNPASRKENP